MDLEKETNNLIKESKKIIDKHGVTHTYVVGYEIQVADKEEYDRIIKESRKAMEEYYEKENSKKETKQKNKRFSTKTKTKR